MNDKHYIYDGESYCIYCLPADASDSAVYMGDGESDVPANCCGCGRPLEYTLTIAGVKYVLDAIAEQLRDGTARATEPTNHINEPSYYRGCLPSAIVADWARDLEWYHLDRRQSAMLKRYLGQVDRAEREARAHDDRTSC